MLGPRIATLRKQKEMSQAELAARLGVSPSAVGMYEQGRREPSCDILLALSSEFGVTVDYLLTGHNRSAEIPPALQSIIPDIRSLTKEDLIILLTAQIIGNM